MKYLRRDRGAVLVVIIDEQTGKLALVMEPAKPLPHYWKFPGGGIEEIDINPKYPNDDQRAADNAARREAKEETGLDVEIIRLDVMPKKTHTLYLYLGLAKDFDDMVKEGGEGEVTNAFSVEEIETLETFFPIHQPILRTALEKIRQK